MMKISLLRKFKNRGKSPSKIQTRAAKLLDPQDQGLEIYRNKTKHQKQKNRRGNLKETKINCLCNKNNSFILKF